MLAVKLGYAATVRAILNFGVTPATILRKDADGSTPLHIAAQNTNTAIVDVLLEHAPTELLYVENSVGQTPLDIASLKNLPLVTDSTEACRIPEVQANVEYQLRLQKNAAPFNVEKQKVQIPRLRATLDALLADGRLVHGTKLADELFAFATCMEEKLATEKEKSAPEKDVEIGDRAKSMVPTQGTRASTYALLQDAAAARPGQRQLVYLADVQQSVERCFSQEVGKGDILQIPVADEEPKEADPEDRRITQLKARSLFGFIPFNLRNKLDFFGEDRF